MPLPRPLAVALAIASIGAPAMAATTVFDNATTFLGQVQAGHYLNTFTGSVIPSSANVYTYADSGFAYRICGAGPACPGLTSGRSNNTWINGAVVSNNYEGYALRILFDSPNVTAIGGSFYGSPPAGGSFIPSTMTITLNDGTSLSYTQSTLADAFRGFTSTTPVASLTLSAVAGRLNTIDNLVVGIASPVPEPSQGALWLTGLLAWLAARRARHAR